MKLTKRFSLILIAILLSVLLVACGGTGEGETTAPSTEAPTAEAPETSGAEPEESTESPAQSSEPEQEQSSDPEEESSSDPEEESSSDPAEESSSDPEEESSSDPAEESSSDPEEESSSEPEESTDGQNPPEVHVHSAVFTDAKAPTCEADGNVAYYHCEGCDGYFSDADCKNALSTVVIPTSGHAWDAGSTVQEGSCTEDGELIYACSACGASRTETVTAPGHDWDGDRTCDAGHACTACGATEPALGHAHALTEDFAGSCTVAPFKSYKCTREGCKDNYTDVLGTAPGHVSSKTLPTERHLEGCEYVLVYQCSACGESYDGDVVEHHTYKASITKAATCKEDGVKTLSCTCGDSYTETIEKNATGHAWNTGSVVDGKRTDTCGVCAETKSVTVFEGTSTGKTNASDLANTEIEVNNASVTLDQGVVDALENKEVTLSVGKVEGDDRKNLGVDEKLLSQVGDNPIYDFTINDGEKNVSEFGKDNFVTITLPYELKDGEDVDSIAIWFINDKGELEAIDAVYNNGYVTFKTNHFSYYTVTSLTPAQRCEAWGHNWTVNTFGATCERDGYTLSVCIRCHVTEKSVTETAKGHKYIESTTAATCDKSGYVLSTCENCDHSYLTRIPAKGHAWAESDRAAASCEKAGYVVYSCGNENCGESYREILPRLKHVYGDTVVPATCVDLGYTEHVCTSCKSSYRDAYVLPLGHDLSATVTPPTCTDFGFTTHTCSRCDYVKEDSPVAALGHDLSESVVPPTCEGEGSRTENCSRCDYSKSTAIPATGHKYTSTEKEPTCLEAGTVTYVCGACQHSYTEAGKPATGHKYTSTEKEPTCLEAGTVTYVCGACNHSYTEAGKPATGHNYVAHPSGATCDQPGKVTYVCDRCKDSYTVDDAPALGHSYEASWNWAKDHSFATLVLTCRHDSAHKAEIGATVESVEHPASCDKDGSREHVARAEFDGAVYTDSVSEKIPTAGHDFVNGEVEYNDQYHRRVCARCGAEDEAAKHTLGEWETVEAPTCAESGVQQAKCTEEKCGYVAREILPATGEHVYVDGVCSSCGKADGACDHTVLTEQTLDFGDLGFCGGLIVYEKCDCGEIKTIPSGEIMLLCKIQPKNMQQGVDEEGNQYFRADYYCTECDLQVSCYGTRSVENCFMTVESVYTFFTEETVILENVVASVSAEYHEGSVWESISLKKLGFCGGDIEVGICTDCGVTRYLEIYSVDCPASWGIEEYTDTDGVYHVIQTMDCPECTLRIVEHEARVEVTDCEFEINRTVTIYDGETVLYEMSRTGYEEAHDDDVKHEMLGDSCDDGVLVTSTCRACGRVESRTSYGHQGEWVTVDLSELVACGGVAESYVCTLCGHAEDSRVYLDCWLEFTKGETFDVDGVEHTLKTYTCHDCGTVLEEEFWSVNETSCIGLDFEISRLLVKNEEVYSLTNSYGWERHQYEYEYTMNGETCEDGYSYEAVCAGCGDERSGSGNGHRYEGFSIDLSELGLCGGWIDYEGCAVCESLYESVHIGLACKAEETYGEYTDAQDILHKTCIRSCSECGMTYIRDEWEESVGSCEFVTHLTHRLEMDGKVLFEGASTAYGGTRHTPQYSYEMHGESCEDGYTVKWSCSVCGEEDSWEQEGHFIGEEQQIALHDLGACYGYVYLSECQICDYTDYYAEMNCWGDWFNSKESEDGSVVVDGAEGFVCANCGFTYTYENSDEQINECIRLHHETLSVKNPAGEEVLRVKDTEKYESHTYTVQAEKHGLNCDEGLTVTRECSACGISKTFEWYGCYMHKSDRDLRELGFCGGVLTETACVGCGAVEYRRVYPHCKWGDVTVSEDGTEHAACSGCGAEYFITRTVGERNEYCEIIETVTTGYFIGGKCVLEMTETDWHYDHNYVVSHEFLDGENCENGVRISRYCTYCGDDYEDTYYHHASIFDEWYYFEDICGHDGYLRAESCPCGANAYVDWYLPYSSYESSFYTDGNGVEHNLDAFRCDDCSIEIRRDSYVFVENCHGVRFETYSVWFDGKQVVEDVTVTEDLGETHDYKYSYRMNGESCEDGYYVVGTCACGVTYENYYDWHEYFDGFKVDLEKYGACYGTVSMDRCPCGEYESFYYDFCVYEEISHDTLTDENGVFHEIIQSVCHKCSTVVTVDHYRVKDGCFEYSYRAYTVICGGETVVDHLVSLYAIAESHDYKYDYALNGESCEDGVTVYALCECGAGYEEYYDWHHALSVFYVDLGAEGACYGYLASYRCPCGAEEYVSEEWCCDTWNDSWGDVEGESSYMDENGVRHYLSHATCSVCGLSVQTDEFTRQNGCRNEELSTYTITLGDKTLVDGVTLVRYYNLNHDYTYSFDLKGESCEDGVNVLGVCGACGDAYEEYIEWHREYELASYDLTEYGACYGYFDLHGCPCGENGYMGTDYCYDTYNPEYFVDENGIEHSVQTYSCATCGLKIVRDSYTLVNGCERQSFSSYSAEIGGTVIFSNLTEESNVWEEHSYVYSTELKGESCEDGYYVFGVCACGDTYEYEGSYHRRYLMWKHELSAYGACGDGWIEFEGCPCGYTGSLYLANLCDGVETHEEWVTVDGVDRYIERHSCKDCGVTVTVEHWGELVGCTRENRVLVTVDANGEMVFDKTECVSKEYCHDYTVSYTLMGESCYDGVTALYVCKRCGASEESDFYYHRTDLIEEILLDEHSACGGAVRYFACPCGEDSHVEWNIPWDDVESTTYVDGDGHEHTVDAYLCYSCGMRYEEDRYAVRDASTCTQSVCYNVSVSVGDTLVGVISFTRDGEEAHRLTVTHQLPEGSTDCSDGYLTVEVCEDCDYYYECYDYGHALYRKESYELSDYGAVCGGQFVVSECPCGKYSTGGFYDTACDFDLEWMSEGWIENAVGYCDWYLGVCAVTDPACAFTYRFGSFYQMDEGSCMARQYNVWQLGYDRQSGEYLAEIVVCTGYTSIMHSWSTQEDASGSDELGDWGGARSICASCGSFEESRSYYDADGNLIHSIYEYVNTMDDGNDRYRYRRQDYELIVTPTGETRTVMTYEMEKNVDANGYESRTQMTCKVDYSYNNEFGDWGCLTVINREDSDGWTYYEEDAYVCYKDRYFTTYAYDEWNGGKNWERQTYTYDPDSVCRSIVTYEDSYGGAWIDERVDHLDLTYETLREPTCTQDGIQVRICTICSETEEFITDPRGHRWDYDYERDFYFCHVCGLENANGANGSVIFEDLSEEYGAGESYVVGYYDNAWGTTFAYHVTLRPLTEDGAESGEEFILDVLVSEREDVRAFAFSRAEVAAYAEKLGYGEGTYLVAFTFVPDDAEGDLDYSIVLTE